MQFKSFLGEESFWAFVGMLDPFGISGHHTEFHHFFTEHLSREWAAWPIIYTAL